MLGAVLALLKLWDAHLPKQDAVLGVEGWYELQGLAQLCSMGL